MISHCLVACGCSPYSIVMKHIYVYVLVAGWLLFILSIPLLHAICHFHAPLDCIIQYLDIKVVGH